MIFKEALVGTLVAENGKLFFQFQKWEKNDMIAHKGSEWAMAIISMETSHL